MTRGEVLFFLSVLLPLLTAGQAPGLFPELHPSSVTVYDTDRGLPISCMESVFIGPKGQLWINPCRSQDIYQDQSFYQYDGEKAKIISLEAPGGKAGSYGWYLKGLSEGGLLFGANFSDTLGFLFDPNNRERWVYSFAANENIRNMLAGAGRQAYALTQTPDAYHIYRLAPEGKKLLVSIPVAMGAQPYFNVSIPALRVGETIWLLCENKGFVRYSLTDNSVKQYDWREVLGTAFREYPPYSDAWTCLNMTIDHRGRLLFYIRLLGGFFVFDPASGQLSRQAQLDAFVKQFNIPGVCGVSFVKDLQENILVGFGWWKGMETTSPEAISAYALLDRNGVVFNYNAVGWSAAAGRYKPGGGTFYPKDDFKKSLLIANPGGLIAIEVKANLSISTFLKNLPLRAMGEIGQGQVLALSDDGQKYIFDLSTGALVRKIDPHSDAPFSKVRAFSQLISRGDELWFSTEKGRLGCYQRQAGAFQYYTVGQVFGKFNFISDSEIAFVSTQNELYRFNLSRNELKPFGPNGTSLQIGGVANEVYTSRNGILWIASLNGLWRIDPKTGASKCLGKTEGLADARILCIQEAKDGKLWLGTLAAGLQRYDPQTGSFERIDQNTGLSNNTVAGILTDAEGNCWVSTFDGLTVLSPEGRVLFELSEEEGLAHREFNRYSYLKTGDGRLLFGGVSGGTLLDPETIKAAYTENEPLRIYLTGIGYYDKKYQVDTFYTGDFDALKPINIPATHRYIQIDFGLSDYNNPDKCAFSYRIERTDDNSPDQNALWTNIGPGSELILNDLPVGEYTILIKGINSKGQWVEKPIAIPVRVQEFFYKTWWFYLLCALPFVLGAYFWIRRLQTERQRLEAEVATRTQQIRQDKELIEQQAASLQEIDELKSRFFTNISHEFRTPLTIISGMITQMQQQPDQWLQKGMELIQRNSNQLLSLINQILDLRKLESGALKVKLVQGDIIPYLRYIAESFVQMAQANGLRMHIVSKPEAVEMDYDPEKMMQILSNLLSNAVKYTPAPGDIYVQIDQTADAGRGVLTIEVKDTGQGIAPEALPYIFDQFYQVEDLATQKPQGSGVGLALTRELVSLLNGSIDVASTLGAGTTFTVSFPITRKAMAGDSLNLPVPESRYPATVDEPAAAAEALSPSTTEKPAGKLENPSGQATLLVVEDNADVRLYLRACLENQYQLLIAENGQEGIDLAIEQVPDLIVSDVMMPVKDGFALCDTLKNDERTSHIPIILLTAKADFESKLSGLRRGADAYLTKPFEQAELLVRLEQLLALRQKLRERYRNPAFHESDPASETARVEDAFVLKLRHHVLDHLLKEGYGVGHLCLALGMSRTQLHNKVRALTDQSTSDFIRAVRLNKARELLQTTDLNVSEVGYEVGISNPAYFSRMYSEAFGETPRDTRR